MPWSQIRLRGASLSCGVAIQALMKLYGEIYELQHGLYAVNEFELNQPSECGENGWEQFLVTIIITIT